MRNAARQVLLLARREIRQGKLTFALSLLTNMLAAAMLAAVLGLGDSMRTTLSNDARNILGGDFELRLSTRGFNEEELSWLVDNTEQLSQITLIRAAAFTQELSALVQLRAVDENYPLLGSIVLADDQPFDHSLLTTPVTNGIPGLVSQDLAGSLGLAVGDRLEIGASEIEVVGLVKTIPDPSPTMLLNAPVTYIAKSSLSATGLDQPGSLRSERIRVMIGGRDPDVWRANLEAAYPDPGWRVRGTDRVVPNLQELIARMETLLLLVSLGTMLIAGICVSNTVSTYLRSRIISIAILRSLGMSSLRIRLAYFLVAILFVLIGASLGLLFGFIGQHYILKFLSGQLPFVVEPVISWRTTLMIPTVAVLVAWLFAVRPLHVFSRTSPTTLFSLSPGQAVINENLPPGTWRAAAIPAALLLGLLALVASDQIFLLYFCVGGVLATYCFRLLANAFVHLLARAQPRFVTLKIALRAVIRSGDQVVAASVSLGIGLTALLTFSLTEANFNRQLSETLTVKTPAYYLIGLQEGDPERLRTETAQWFGSKDSFRTLPIMRVRISHIKGVPIEDVERSDDSDWIIRGYTTWVKDQNNEWFGTARVSDGDPWTPSNDAQLISIDANAANDLGLEIGDEMNIVIQDISYRMTIANFRRIDWSTFDVNFGLVLSDGPWSLLSHGYLGSSRDLIGDDFAYQRKVVEVAPSVTPIRTKTIVASVTAMLAKIGILLQLVTITASVSGVLVLAAALAEGRHRRAYESVVMRILGMPHKMLTAMFRTEFIVIAALSVLPSLLIGILTSYSVTVFLLNLTWRLEWLTALLVLVGTLLTVLFIGTLSTRQLVRTPPLTMLRNN